MPKVSFQEIEKVIEKAKPEEQKRLLKKLFELLHLSPEDFAWLKLQEPCFDFWNNPEDQIYDQL